MNALWQTALVQTESDLVACGRSKIRQSVVQIEDERCRRHSAKRNRWVATLKPPERIVADKQAGRHIARGDAALAPGKREVTAQLAKRVGDKQRDGASFRHEISILYF
ncbi:MAG TPA: hypothetical protein VMQ67_14435 [Candidatus Saccharimonadales bacterium]|nr:hypothetical protein [Candidatus Saccharimonadales bacterium]